MGRSSIVLLVAVLLAGCAHKLPVDDATAFRTLATANRDSFQALAKSENDSVTTFVSRRLQEGIGEVSYVGCKLAPVGDEAKQPCTVVWADKVGKRFELRPTAPATRELIGALAGYGDQMATLAEAKDVTQAQASIDGVATSIKALGTAVGLGPIAGVIVDAASWLEKGRMVDKRRRALLAAAEKADEAVQLASVKMGEIAVRLRDNLSVTANSRITDAYLRVGDAKAAIAAAAADSQDGVSSEAATEVTLAAVAPAAGPSLMANALAELVQATQDFQAARGLAVDYSSLGTAHTKLIEALRDPKRSTAEALADLKTFLTLLKAAETATKGK